MPQVSILVAIFNAESYLEDCLNSLLNQSYENLQIICIDDASSDASPKILRDYATKDNRITPIFLSKNVGQAKARNIGLRKVTGEFVTMLDSDDWFSKDAISGAINVFLKNLTTDVVVFKLCKWYSDEHVELYPLATKKNLLVGEEAFFLSLDWRLHGLYMVRTSIHKKYPFDTSCRLYSDDNTSRLHYLHARFVRFTEGIYYYRQHRESSTNEISLRRFYYLDANLSMKRILLQENVSERVINYYETQRWLNLVGLYWFWYKHQDSFSSEDLHFIKRKISKLLLTIEKYRIDRKLRCKFGFIPTKSFTLFHLQSMLHFFIRRWYYRMMKKD